jgi:Trk K+ transport system NAD-binding subunit
MGRFGSGIAAELTRRGHTVLGVDFDPELVRGRGRPDIALRYGDAKDPESLAALPLQAHGWVVSSVRDKSVNLSLLQGLQAYGYQGRVAVTAHSSGDAGQLLQAGADRVLIPYADAAVEAVDKLLGPGIPSPSATRGGTRPAAPGDGMSGLEKELERR